MKGWSVLARMVDAHRKPVGPRVLVAGLAIAIVVSTSGRAQAATGTLLLDVPVRWPGAGRVNAPASGAKVLVNGVTTSADVAGVLTWAGSAAATVQAQAQTAQIQVVNAAGPAATAILTLSPGGSVTWSASAVEAVDAQLSAFFHTEKARSYCKRFAPSLGYLDGPVLVTVNGATECDAEADGTNLFFGASASNCENPARVADVVYQTFGANLYASAVAAAGSIADGPLRLAAGDYLAATITGDPGIAPGFDRTATPLRTIDPAGREYAWPLDAQGDDATTSLIASGAWWDLRKLMVTKLGAAAGDRVRRVVAADAAVTVCLRRFLVGQAAFVHLAGRRHPRRCPDDVRRRHDHRVRTPREPACGDVRGLQGRRHTRRRHDRDVSPERLLSADRRNGQQPRRRGRRRG